MLGGGLPAGSVTMIHGASGSGKTLLGTSFLVEGARRGQRGLYFGFFETPRGAGRQVGGHRAADERPRHARDLLDIVWRPPFDLLADKLAYEILGVARDRGIERVFIDGMRGLHQSLIEPARARVFLAALANELRAQGLITMVSEEKHELADDDLPEHGLASSLDNIVFPATRQGGESPPQGPLGREDAERGRRTPSRASSSSSRPASAMASGTPAGDPHAHDGSAPARPERLAPPSAPRRGRRETSL